MTTYKTKMRVLPSRPGRPKRLVLAWTQAYGGGYYATTLAEGADSKLEVLTEDEMMEADMVDVDITPASQ